MLKRLLVVFFGCVMLKRYLVVGCVFLLKLKRQHTELVSCTNHVIQCSLNISLNFSQMRFNAQSNHQFN